MSENNIERRFKVDKKPPESGWSYLVPIGLALAIACTWSSSTFSLLFDDFLSKLVKDSSAVAIIITGTYNSVSSFAGLLASILFKKFEMRAIGIFGSFLFFIGSLLIVFATSIEQIFFTYAILQGAQNKWAYRPHNIFEHGLKQGIPPIIAIGDGLMTPCAYTTFNAHFIEKRMLVMSAVKFFIGISSIAYPIMVEFIMKKYNLRSALAVLAAFSNCAVIGMLSMHPVEWRYKYIEITDTESLCSNDLDDQIKSDDIQTGDDQNIAHISSMSNENLIRESENIESNRNGWRRIFDYLDLPLLKDFGYLNLVFGVTCAISSFTAFITLQPIYLIDKMGFSQEETAMMLSIGSGASLASNLSITFLSLCFRVKARYIFLTGAILAGIFRIVFLKICTLFGMIVISVAIGFSHSLLLTSMQLVFAEYLPQERFAFGYGFFMFVQGNLGFIIGAIIGWIRDVTDSYEISFYLLALIMSLCIVPWTIEIAWVKLFRRRFAI